VKMWPCSRGEHLYIAVEVVGEHRHHAGTSEGRRREASSDRRILHRNGSLPFLLVRVEEVGVGLSSEGAGDGFAEAEGEETGADSGFLCGKGVGDDGHRGGKGVGRSGCNRRRGLFFYEVDFAFEV